MLIEFLTLGLPPSGGPSSTLKSTSSQRCYFQVRLYRPPSLLSEGVKARVYIVAFTPLANHLCSTDSIFVFSSVMVWFGLSVCMHFAPRG